MRSMHAPWRMVGDGKGQSYRVLVSAHGNDSGLEWFSYLNKVVFQKKNISKFIHKSANYGRILFVTHNKKKLLKSCIITMEHLFLSFVFFSRCLSARRKVLRTFFFWLEKKKNFFQDVWLPWRMLIFVT